MAPGAPPDTPFQRRIGRIIRLGRTPEMAPSEARYVVLTNIIALLGATFTLGFAPVLLLTGTWLYPALQLAFGLGYLPTLWLNHRRHHAAATLWLLLGSHLFVLAQVLVEGAGFDVHLFFMLHALLPFLVCAPRQSGAMFALAALAGVDLLVVISLGDRFAPLGPAIAPEQIALLRPILLGGLFGTLVACAFTARRATLLAEAALDQAHRRSEELLLNILPPTIADRLKRSGGTIADGFADVTVLFADIVGFTRMSARLAPSQIVGMLDELFCTFDDVAGRLGLEKIKTIGDCYMVAGGLPEPRGDHAEAVAQMGLAMLGVVREFGRRIGEPLAIRVGIHSGPVVAGVIGKRKFIYDMWGDTVNTASRMESHGVPGAVQVSADTNRLLAGKFHMTRRGEIDVKGKGVMETWLVEGVVDDGSG